MIRNKELKNWTGQTRARLNKLTYINGMMRMFWPLDGRWIDTFVYFLDNQPIGWASITKNEQKNVIYIYVAKRFRRTGVGTALVKRAKKKYGTLYCRANLRFFDPRNVYNLYT